MKLTTMATKLITRIHIALHRKTGGRLGDQAKTDRQIPVVVLTPH